MKTHKNLPLNILLLVSFILLALGGCSRRVLDFTIVSSKQMNMQVVDTGRGDRVVGKDGVYFFLFLPLGTPQLKEAVDRAIESAGPGYDALIDGVIYSESYYYILTAYSGFKVEGTPVKTAELRAELLKRGENADLVLNGLLYHSSAGKSNKKAIAQIGITEITENERALD